MKLNKNNKVKVSVILTVYNHEMYLSEALDSIINQETNFRYEVIIGDDASTDRSSLILEDYMARYPDIFVIIFRKINLGGSKNFTDLFRRCRGEYITFIDGDDYWIDKNKLQIQFDYLEKNNSIFSVTHITKICNSDGEEIGIVPEEQFDKEIRINHVLAGKRFALTATLVRAIHEEELDDLLSRVESGPRNAGDLTIALFFLNKSPIHVIQRIMSVYRYRSKKGDSNYNSTVTLTEKINNKIMMLSINEKYLSTKYYFGLMYLRLFGVSLRGVFNNDKNNIFKLSFLGFRILILFGITSVKYIYFKILFLIKK